MATLFRAADPAATNYFNTVAPPIGGPIIQAALWSPSSAAPGVEAVALPVAPAEARPIGNTPGTTTGGHSSSPAPLSGAPEVTPPLAQPAIPQQPTDQSGDTPDDTNWKRLQTILYKHEEKQAEETAAVEADRVNTTTPPAAEAAAPAVQRQVGEKHAVVTPSPAASRPVAPGSPGSKTISTRPGDSGPAATPLEPSAAGMPPISSPPTATDAPGTVRRAEVITPPPGDDEHVTAESSVSEAGPGQMEQPLPLEAVWPVKSVEPVQRQEVSPSAPVLRPEPTAGPVAPESRDEDMSEARAQVRDALRAVTSGRPTDSSVELLLPRRPRPSVQRQAAAGKAINVSEPAATPAMSPSSQHGQPLETADPGMVQTEIGPLPADLWQLLGQAPPAPTEQAVASDMTQMARQATGAADVRAVPSPPLVEVGPAPAATVAPETIRRAVAVEPEPAPDQAAASFEATTSAPETAGTVMRTTAEATPPPYRPSGEPGAAPIAPETVATVAQVMAKAETMPLPQQPPGTLEPAPTTAATAVTVMRSIAEVEAASVAQQGLGSPKPAPTAPETEQTVMRTTAAEAAPPHQRPESPEPTMVGPETAKTVRQTTTETTSPHRRHPSSPELTPAAPEMADTVMRTAVAVGPTAMAGPQPVSPELMPAESEAAGTIMRAIARVEAPLSGLAPPAGSEVALPNKMDAVEHRSAPPANVSAWPGQHPEAGEATGETMTTPFIQRQPESAPDVAAPVSLDAGEVAEGEESAGEIDIDELARRVFSDIKHRLAVEWERVRGRF